MSIEPLFLLCVVYMECTLQAFTAVPAPTQVSAVSVLATLCASDSMLMLVKSLLYTHTLITFPYSFVKGRYRQNGSFKTHMQY